MALVRRRKVRRLVKVPSAFCALVTETMAELGSTPRLLLLAWPSVSQPHQCELLIEHCSCYNTETQQPKAGAILRTSRNSQTDCDASVTHEVRHVATRHKHPRSLRHTHARANSHPAGRRGSKRILWMTECWAVFESHRRAMSESHSFIPTATARDMFVPFQRCVS